MEINIKRNDVNIDSMNKSYDINVGFKKIKEKVQCIEVSTTEPTNKDVMLWYEIASDVTDVDLNEFNLENNGNDLAINYQDELGLDFNMVDNELIVTNDVSELDFNINENKEMEVSYGN